MRVIPHSSKVLPYLGQSLGVIRIVLPLDDWTEEALDGEALSIAQSYELMNLTERGLFNSFILIVDGPLVGILGLT